MSDMGEVSDGYHTFNELYKYRLIYNAGLFNEWAFLGINDVHKSWHHSDAPDEPIFSSIEHEWFVVVAELPAGQISNHYRGEFWNYFQIPERLVANEYDGHTPEMAADRLSKFVRLRRLL